MDHPHIAGENDVAIFAETDSRGKRQRFGIRLPDRRAHMYIIGKTGVGKSTLLETLIRHDINVGHGVALLDPHSDLVERILANIPKHRAKDLIYFDVTDTAYPLAFNPLQRVPKRHRSLAAAGMLSVFKHLWDDSWGPRLEHILRNALLALMDQPSATLADVLLLLSNKEFRGRAIKNIQSDQVRSFWKDEFESYPARLRVEAIAPVQNKVGAFLADPIMNRILTQRESSFRLRDVMDQRKILLINLAKGRLGSDTTSLLGSLIVARFGLAAMSRADTSEHLRRDYFLYLDEFHNFMTLSLADMLSELRKYRLNLILAHQYTAQMIPPVLEAVIGNVGTLITFRIGGTDAQLLGPEFNPEIKASDFTRLPNYHIYLKLMIDGTVSEPFSATTLASK